MNKFEKLNKLMKLASDNGFKAGTSTDLQGFSADEVMSACLGGLRAELVPFILSLHSFAKALWGEEHAEEFDSITSECGRCKAITRSYYDSYGDGKFRTKYCWQHHLQQAVISDDPLEYYWKNK